MDVPRWIDISVGLANGMVCWPGDEPLAIRRVADMAGGAAANVSALALSAHSGTHVDAPLHFVAQGASIDAMPLEATMGPARVIGIEARKSIEARELESHDIQPGERVLFRTRNSDGDWARRAFDEAFVHLSPQGAEHLVRRRVRAVGVDYLSVGGYRRGGVLTHQILLGGGIWIIEGLNLGGVDPGEYELACLPLKLIGAEGAPARAAVRRLGG